MLVLASLLQVVLCGLLDPLSIPKYENELFIPPAMVPASRTPDYDYYEIALCQFVQQVLPPSMGLKTTVLGYGQPDENGFCNTTTTSSPSATIEATQGRNVKIKWVNGLFDKNRHYLPHIFPVDQTIHWANPAGPLDSQGQSQDPYMGPVPMISHIHGATTDQSSDGFPEAWFLPNATNLKGYQPHGSKWQYFRSLSPNGHLWGPGTIVTDVSNTQRPGTLWFHDHTLGITRLTVAAGAFGFYIIRNQSELTNGEVLPGPAPAVGDPPNTQYFEIMLAIQDRLFSTNGSAYYPDNRAFYDGLEPSQLSIPFYPDMACDGQSDAHKIWGPEYFGNVMIVNGKAWPKLQVSPQRYRFRLLNACNARTLIVQLSNNLTYWLIGNEGGLLLQPIQVSQVLLSNAERMDFEIDFTGMEGQQIFLQNVGPDLPYDAAAFDPADPQTTGQLMRFDVVLPSKGDPSTPPSNLKLPYIPPPDVTGAPTRMLSLTENESSTVKINFKDDGSIYLDCDNSIYYGPTISNLGVIVGGSPTDGVPVPMMWSDPPTENVTQGETEIWEIVDYTEDAHPLHIHQVQFQVLNRESLDTPGVLRVPFPWETGFKDTILIYPDDITRVAVRFNIPGLFVWHCHVLEHEDYEMMRPLIVLPAN